MKETLINTFNLYNGQQILNGKTKDWVVKESEKMANKYIKLMAVAKAKNVGVSSLVSTKDKFGKYVLSFPKVCKKSFLKSINY